MAKWQRARRPEQKEERHAAILNAAAELFRVRGAAEVSIGAIAEGAGLAKGSVYRYYATKEEVLLAVLARELSDWFSEVNAYLQSQRGQGDPEAVARALTASLSARELTTLLLARLSSDLERNLSLEAARTFKVETLQRVAETGALLEAALPGLPEGAGARFIGWLQALLSGLWPMAHPVGSIREVLAMPELAPHRVDFAVELEAAAVVLLRGLAGGGAAS